MPIAFTNPWALVLLAAVPYVIYLSRRSLADLSRWRRRVTTGLRLVIVVLLVLAVAGAQLAKRKDALCVLFVLDQSDSIPADKKRAELEWVHRAAQGLHRNLSARRAAGRDDRPDGRRRGKGPAVRDEPHHAR